MIGLIPSLRLIIKKSCSFVEQLFLSYKGSLFNSFFVFLGYFSPIDYVEEVGDIVSAFVLVF